MESIVRRAPLSMTSSNPQRAWIFLFAIMCHSTLAACGTESERQPQNSPIYTETADAEDIVLPEEAQGQRAIDLLGSKLGDVASRHGMSAAELRNLLLRDRTLWVDRRGQLFYRDRAPNQRRKPPEQAPIPQ